MNGIMPRGARQLLLPATPGFIWASLVSAFVLNMVLGLWWLGRAAWRPDILAVVLVFWNIHQPRRVGMGAAFLLGLITDVHEAALLGEHAFVYVLVSFIAISLHRRVLWFKTMAQSVQLLPLFAMLHGVQWGLRMFFDGHLTDWTLVFAPVLETLLWLPASVVLLAPQRRSPDPDAERPL